MKLERRTFLQGVALGAAGMAASATARSATTTLPPFDAAKPEEFWQAVRRQYPLSRDWTYFNAGGLGPTLQPVLDAVADTTRRLQPKAEHGHALFAGARATVARFLGAEPDEIAFVRNATEGNAIVAAGIRLSPGDEIILETHAHPGGSIPWLTQQNLRGVTVRFFEPDPADSEENVRRVLQLITPRTRAVQVSHVTAPTGIVMPVAALGRACREHGIWFHVDGAQSAGMIPITLRELQCDSFATSGHKWLGGPLESGVLFVRREKIGELPPTLAGAYSGDLDGLPGTFRPGPTAVRYEYGTRNPATALGLAAATSFHESVGPARIAARGRELAERLRAGLAGLRGIEILTPSASGMSASMITFRSRDVPYDQLFGRLLRDHSIRTRPVTEQQLNALRVSTHIFNSPAECDALVLALDRILRA